MTVCESRICWVHSEGRWRRCCSLFHNIIIRPRPVQCPQEARHHAGHHSIHTVPTRQTACLPATCWLKACGQLWIFIQVPQYTWQAGAPLTVRARICHLGSRSFLLLSVFRLIPGQILKGVCCCSQRKVRSKQVIQSKARTLSKVYLVLTTHKTSKTFHEIKIQKLNTLSKRELGLNYSSLNLENI